MVYKTVIRSHILRRSFRDLRTLAATCFLLALTLLIFSENAKHRVYQTTLHDSKHPAWMRGSNQDLLQNGLRCTEEDMGCFSLVSAKFQDKMEVVSRDKCLEICFSKNNTYAGVTANGKCYCAMRLERFVTKEGCDIARSVDISHGCRGQASVRIFRIVDCQKGITEQALAESKVGCSRVPGNQTGSLPVFRRPAVSKQQCFLTCERHGLALAMPHVETELCSCFEPSALFSTAEEMRDSVQSCSSKDHSLLPFYYTSVRTCGPSVFLKPKQAPFNILTSFWGSGNTWVRHLIERATGIYTGSLYMDNMLFRGGMLGEKLHFLSGRTIVIKDHLMSRWIDRHYASAILLVRNPFDATLAEFARLQSHNDHVSLIDPQLYESEDFQNFVKELPYKWWNHAERVFQRFDSILVVYYEEVFRDPVKQIRRIVKFLPSKLARGHGVAFERRLMCMFLDLKGGFKRKSKGLTKNPFTNQTKGDFISAIRQMNTIMKAHRKSPLPLSYYEKWEI